MEVLTSDEIYSKVEELVKGARESVRISSAWLRSSALGNLLGSIPDGVSLEVILRASELQDLIITDPGVFELIKGKGGKVYLHGRLHAKFILVDDSRAVVGSANFTYAGLSQYESGNVEAGVYLDSSDDPKEVKELSDYFERIKGDSILLDGSLVGFAMNPVKTRSFEFVALEEVKEQDYVKLKEGEREVLGRVVELYSYDMDFFANPFTAGESGVFAPVETFKTLFGKGDNPDWKKAATVAYLNDNGSRVKLAVAEVVGEIVEERGKRRLETPLSPLSAGSFVLRLNERELSDLLKLNFSGSSMELPVKVGKLTGSGSNAFLDFKEVSSKHLLILGTTGSGKSHFTKLFLSRVLERDKEVQLFILDPHGEYREGLEKFGVAPSLIYEKIMC
ncbi:helicase HerA domain-containing protein [Thermovibrio sp.]